jgi:hypothetical protein
MSEDGRNLTPELFWVVDLDLRFKIWSGEAVTVGDKLPGSVIGRTLHHFYTSPDHVVIRMHEEALRGTHGIRYETDYGGQHFQARLSPIRAEGMTNWDGKPWPYRANPHGMVGVIGMALDVSLLLGPTRAGQVATEAPAPPPRVYGVKELAAIFGLSPGAVRKRFARGVFPQYKLAGNWAMTQKTLDDILHQSRSV